MQTFVLRDETVLRRLGAFLRQNWLGCAQQGRPLAVSVVEHKAKRSSQQNRLYWALLRQISEGAWVRGRRFPADVWHEHMAGEMLGIEDVELPSGAIVRRAISTASLSVPEMTEYIERVAQYATDTLGIEVNL